ncbi:MAG: hypothetical protein KatS3mg054_0209 [Chloroflexus sp.]|nr:MAG: hypothetical protein KatS3mg054_0209 [Chloroflexus sp.]
MSRIHLYTSQAELPPLTCSVIKHTIVRDNNGMYLHIIIVQRRDDIQNVLRLLSEHRVQARLLYIHMEGDTGL